MFQSIIDYFSSIDPILAALYASLFTSAIAMTGGEGFTKVMPAAIGFFLGALFIFGIDKVLPHLHINFKVSEGIKSPWQRTTLLVSAITLHNIPEGLAVGVLFGGVAAGIPEASIAGAVTLAIGIGIQNFPEGIAVAMPLRRMGRTIFGNCRTYCCSFRSFCSDFFHSYFALRSSICCRRHDFCSS